MREQHANKKQTPMWTLAQARANKTADRLVTRRAACAQVHWPPHVFKNYDLAEIAQYIDWGPFFQTWDLAGPFPAILDDEVVGEQARKVYADGQAMLQKIIDGRWVTANAVLGCTPPTA